MLINSKKFKNLINLCIVSAPLVLPTCCILSALLILPTFYILSNILCSTLSFFCFTKSTIFVVLWVTYRGFISVNIFPSCKRTSYPYTCTCKDIVFVIYLFLLPCNLMLNNPWISTFSVCSVQAFHLFTWLFTTIFFFSVMVGLLISWWGCPYLHSSTGSRLERVF